MITSGLEDYLEHIYNSVECGKNIKAVDIARDFNISRASVSEALIRLSDKDLIVYEGRKGIKLTQSGLIEAKRIIKKHNVLSDFFQKVLGIEKNLSSENACKIEHVIDEKIIEKISSFTCYCLENHIHFD